MSTDAKIVDRWGLPSLSLRATPEPGQSGCRACELQSPAYSVYVDAFDIGRLYIV